MALGFLALAVTACSGSAVVLPRSGTHPTATPHGATTPTPTPAATATVTASGALLPDATVSAALATVGSYYATLPHANLSSDLQSLATQMVSSGQFASATVGPGGITGRLSDGELALVFADVPEDVSSGTNAAVRAASTTRAPQYTQTTIGPPAPHSYVFLYDDVDAHFLIGDDATWAQAFNKSAFTDPVSNNGIANYSVSAASISLANIAGFGTGYGIDYLSFSTHGMIANVATSGSSNPKYQYFMQSTTSMSQRNAYLPDVLAGNVAVAISLVNDSSATLPGLAFTPAWVTSKLQFNSGAVFNLDACFGANPLVDGDNQVTFSNAKIGRWYAWTKAVGIDDFYQTWSFGLDRLLGEFVAADDGMGGLATQRYPAQRPFPLDDVYSAMQSEPRSTTNAENFATSDIGYQPNASFPPLADGNAARLVVADFGYESQSGAPVVYALPSIATMSIAEAPGTSTLTIDGHFPTAQGGVSIVDGTGQHPLPVTSWTTSQIVATIPSSGAGSAGNVLVNTAADLSGVSSQPAPITQWSGTVVYAENDDITNLAGSDGTGSGNVKTTFNLTFRSDVHPTVPQIDTTPQPQALYFQYAEDNSTATVDAASGNFTVTGGSPPPEMATIAIGGSPVLTEADALPLAARQMIVGTYPGQPSTCNTAAGPLTNASNVYCPAFGFFDGFVGTCTDSDSSGDLCGSNSTFAPVGGFGSPSLEDPGIVTFTMDPSSYAIAVDGPDTQFTRQFAGDGAWPADATVTGTIGSPAFPPGRGGPAARTRGGSPAARKRF